MRVAVAYRYKKASGWVSYVVQIVKTRATKGSDGPEETICLALSLLGKESFEIEACGFDHEVSAGRRVCGPMSNRP